MDLGIQYDLFTLLRGTIAGAVSISVSPSGFEAWTALINGFFAGLIYQIAVKIAYMIRIDDAMHICQTHGACAFYSLFSICLFHKTEGFFFNEVFTRNVEGLSEEEISMERSKIIVILGSNSLGALTVFLAIGICSVLTFKFLFNLCFTQRINKDEEICGLDTILRVETIKNIRVKNHVADLINEFYPDNIQDFLINKQKLLFKVRDGNE